MNKKPKDADLTNLDLLISTGAHVPSEQLIEIRDGFKPAKLLFAYGQTELSGGAIKCVVNDMENVIAAHGSPIGRVVDNLQVKVN